MKSINIDMVEDLISTFAVYMHETEEGIYSKEFEKLCNLGQEIEKETEVSLSLMMSLLNDLYKKSDLNTKPICKILNILGVKVFDAVKSDDKCSFYGIPTADSIPMPPVKQPKL